MALRLAQRADNQVFFASGTIAGMRIRKTLGTKNRAEAKERLREVEQEILFGTGTGLLPRRPLGPGNRTIREVAREYLASRSTSSSPGVKAYIKRIEKRIGHIPVRSFRQPQWEAYVAQYLHKCKDSTVKREGRQLGALINFAHRLGYCDAVRLALPPEGEPENIVIEDDEFEAARAWLEEHRPEFLRPLLFLRYTGARPIEVRRLRRHDVELIPPTAPAAASETEAGEHTAGVTPSVHGYVTLRWMKGHKRKMKSRRVPLHPIAAEAIGLPAWACKGDAPVFINEHTGLQWTERRMGIVWAEAREATGIRKELGLYSIRHAFATQLGRAGVPIRTIAALIGHADLKDTMRYVSSSSADQEAAVLML